jgi:hypothetical protein
VVSTEVHRQRGEPRVDRAFFLPERDESMSAGRLATKYESALS